MMRSRFDEQLTQLNRALIQMGALIESAISKATDALTAQDTALANAVIAGDLEIDEMEKEIESRCLKLLLIQQPVARDFRVVSTALKIITDMERIGDQAADISEICLYIADQPYLIELVHLREMARAAATMVTQSIDAFVAKDTALAARVIDSDDRVDALYLQIKSDLIKLIHSDVKNGEQAFDLLQIAKYYERIGDHAVNIAEWVIFSVTGVYRNKQVL